MKYKKPNLNPSITYTYLLLAVWMYVVLHNKTCVFVMINIFKAYSRFIYYLRS